MVAVTSFKRLTGESRSVQMLDTGGWEVTETWQAKFDGELTDPLDFLGDPSLPSIGTAHPNNSLLYLKTVPNGVPPIDKTISALNFTLVWSTQILAAADKHDAGRYVDSVRATKSWGHRVVQEGVEKAYVSDDDGVTWSGDQVPPANTINDLFVPGITTNRYMPACQYSRNELVIPAAVLDLPGYINNDVFTLDGVSVAIGTALITAASVSPLKRSDSYNFRTVDFEIVVNEKQWNTKLLNIGFYTIYSGIKERCMQKNGKIGAEERPYVISEEPVALNIDGEDRLNVEENAGTFEEHYRWFRHLTFTSFTALGFN